MIAVTFDIIAKGRELAGQDEAASKAFVMKLDDANEANDKRKLQTIEAELLNKANSDLQLITPHEFNALSRLKENRHLCTHTAFVIEDELCQPAQEPIRKHNVHSLHYLLVYVPLQGKSAIGRFEADLRSPLFPVVAEKIGAFVTMRYLDRALATYHFGQERSRIEGKSWESRHIMTAGEDSEGCGRRG